LFSEVCVLGDAREARVFCSAANFWDGKIDHLRFLSDDFPMFYVTNNLMNSTTVQYTAFDAVRMYLRIGGPGAASCGSMLHFRNRPDRSSLSVSNSGGGGGKDGLDMVHRPKFHTLEQDCSSDLD
jgi:hypothetical protein